MCHEYNLSDGKVETTLYSSDAPMNPLTYSDALSVLLGILPKMAREGYRNTSARVLRTRVLESIGPAAVCRPGIARVFLPDELGLR